MSTHGKSHNLGDTTDHSNGQQWTSLQTTVTAASANWQGTYTTVQSTSAKWSAPTVTTLTNSTSVLTNALLGDIFNVTLTGNVILANPTNFTNGQAITWWLKQDAVGSRTITLDGGFSIPRSATTPLSFSASANYMDMLAVRCDTSNNKFYVVSMVPGY